MAAPVLLKPIPPQIVNEQAAYGPFSLTTFVQTPGKSPVHFRAELSNGQALPKGLICTADGILTGIPAKDTHGNYEILVTAENEEGAIKSSFVMTIKPSFVKQAQYVDTLKRQVWEAVGQNLPIPMLESLYDRPITAADIYYLLERFAPLTIWDAFNLDIASDKHLLQLEGASPHFHVYDRVSCLVATPKDLFSHERTLEDALQTARAMAREVYKRGWTIEMAGFEKMTRAVWVEVQHLIYTQGRELEILHFNPTIKDMQIFKEEAAARELKQSKLEFE